MTKNIEGRLRTLEDSTPDDIVLYLDNGQEYRYRGTGLQFFDEGLDQINRGRGPLADALAHTIRAEGCGLLHELLQSLQQAPLKRSKRRNK